MQPHFEVKVTCQTVGHEIHLTMPHCKTQQEVMTCMNDLEKRFARLARKARAEEQVLARQIKTNTEPVAEQYRALRHSRYCVSAYSSIFGKPLNSSFYSVALSDFVEEFKNEKLAKREESGHPSTIVINKTVRNVSQSTSTMRITPPLVAPSGENACKHLTAKDFFTVQQLQMLVNHSWTFRVECADKKYYDKGAKIGSVLLGPAEMGLHDSYYAFSLYAPISGFYVFDDYIFQYNVCHCREFECVMLDDKRLMNADFEFGGRTLNYMPSVCFVYPDVTHSVTDDFYLDAVLRYDAFEQKRRLVWMSNRTHEDTKGFSMHIEGPSSYVSFCLNSTEPRFNMSYTHGEFLNRSMKKGDKLQFVLADDSLLEFICINPSRKYESAKNAYERKQRYASFDISDKQIEQLTRQCVKNMRLVFADGEQSLYFNPIDHTESLRLQYFAQLYVLAMIQCGKEIVSDRSHFFKKSTRSAVADRGNKVFMSCDMKGNLFSHTESSFEQHREEWRHKGALKAVAEYHSQQISESLSSFGVSSLGFLGGFLSSITGIFKKK